MPPSHIINYKIYLEIESNIPQPQQLALKYETTSITYKVFALKTSGCWRRAHTSKRPVGVVSNEYFSI